MKNWIVFAIFCIILFFVTYAALMFFVPKLIGDIEAQAPQSQLTNIAIQTVKEMTPQPHAAQATWIEVITNQPNLDKGLW